VVISYFDALDFMKIIIAKDVSNLILKGLNMNGNMQNLHHKPKVLE